MKKFTKISREDFNKIKEDKKSIEVGYHDDIIDRNISRKDIVDIYDKTFFNSVMTMFENNQLVNSCFIDDFSNKSNIDWTKSYGVQYDKLNSCIYLEDGVGFAEIYSRKIFTNNENESTLNNFFLVVDENIHRGCNVEYYILTDKNDEYIIKQNNKNALIIKDNLRLPQYVTIKIVIKRSKNTSNTPYISGISLMYEDEHTKDQLNVFSPKFTLQNDDPDDLLVLYRDDKNDDVLYKVESSKEKTNLYYDDNNQLMYIDVLDIKSNLLKSRVELIYEDYINSKGVTERVLGKVKTINSVTK